MSVMAVMVGIQASGKSTFCRQMLPHYVRISLDELHTRNKEKLAIEDAIGREADIVIDNTNPTVDERRKYITAAQKAGYKVMCYFMQSRINDCIARNAMRTGKERIPVTAIAATSNRLEMPSREEGFDEIWFVSITNDGFAIDKWR